MKFKINLLFIFIVASLNAIAQENNDNKLKYYKHEFGIQFNPLFNKSFSSGYKTYISSATYVYRLNKHLAIGPTISNSHLYSHSSISSNTYNMGIVAKLKYSNLTRFIPFAEVYTGMQYGKLRYRDYVSIEDIVITRKKFNYYVAPGVKIMIINSRLSFDLMYKVSSIKLYNNKNAVFSWRFCYSFGKTTY